MLEGFLAEFTESLHEKYRTYMQMNADGVLDSSSTQFTRGELVELLISIPIQDELQSAYALQYFKDNSLPDRLP